jgi:iron complex transport system substrate-binding protein
LRDDDVAKVLGCKEQGEALILRERRRMSALAERTRPLARVTTVCLEWVDPPFAMGNWGPELVELAGGDCLLGNAGEHSETTPWSDVARADPEVLVVAPCGFGLERARLEMPLLERHPDFRSLRAVKGGRVFVADGNRFFNRSGPSVFESAEILAEMLHPEVFAPVHCDTAWIRWISET